MNKKLKVTIHFMVFALFFQLVPIHIFAESTEIPLIEDFEVVTLSAYPPKNEIDLFEDEHAQDFISTIPDGALVQLIETFEEYSKVLYKFIETVDDESSEVSLIGFVHNRHFAENENLLEIEINENLDSNETSIVEKIANEETNAIEAEDVKDVEVVEEADEVNFENQQNIEESTELVEDIYEINEELTSEPTTFKTMALALPVTPTLEGVALKKPTNVYLQASEASSVLKSYKQGHVLKFHQYTSEWFIATVYLNGKPETGFINANDVDLLIEQKELQGFGLVQPVKVYQNPTRDAAVLKSYPQGTSLIYRSFSSKWYIATVYVNGKAHTGYIHANDVGPEVIYKGVATANTVSVYSSTTKSSTKLKTYRQGHILVYGSYNSSWYKATVYLNGKAQSGYIYSGDVENIITNQVTLNGVGAKSSTIVYSSASASSQVLKSYKQGHILKFRTFTSNWYEATVIINGKARTGYIHKSDVEEITNKQQSLKGIAAKSPTNVYASASHGSAVLKSYAYASSLIYKTYTENWYIATVYVNGKARTGYIHKNDVLNIVGKSVVLDPGHGGSDSGAIGIGIVEKTLNLDIALRTKNLLENAGFTVIMTRTTDVFIPLADRTAIANDSNADIFISIHGNSFNRTTNGIESFWYGKYEKENSIKLANALQTNMVNLTGMRHRRVAEGNFHVIRETKIPSSLVEVGFIDNESDAAKLRQSKYRQLTAQGILQGVIDYFN